MYTFAVNIFVRIISHGGQPCRSTVVKLAIKFIQTSLCGSTLTHNGTDVHDVEHSCSRTDRRQHIPPASSKSFSLLKYAGTRNTPLFCPRASQKPPTRQLHRHPGFLNSDVRCQSRRHRRIAETAEPSKKAIGIDLTLVHVRGPWKGWLGLMTRTSYPQRPRMGGMLVRAARESALDEESFHARS